MATIRTTLALYDGVTGPLKAMCRGMNALINTMDSVKDTFGDSFDPTVLQQIREDLAEATVGFDQMEQNIRQADKAQSKFNNSGRQFRRWWYVEPDQENCRCGGRIGYGEEAG